MEIERFSPVRMKMRLVLRHLPQSPLCAKEFQRVIHMPSGCRLGRLDPFRSFRGTIYPAGGPAQAFGRFFFGLIDGKGGFQLSLAVPVVADAEDLIDPLSIRTERQAQVLRAGFAGILPLALQQ